MQRADTRSGKGHWVLPVWTSSTFEFLLTCVWKYSVWKLRQVPLIQLPGFSCTCCFSGTAAVMTTPLMLSPWLGMNAGCRQCQTDPSLREPRQRALWHFGKCQRVPPVLLPARVSVLRPEKPRVSPGRPPHLCRMCRDGSDSGGSCLAAANESQNISVLQQKNPTGIGCCCDS